MFLLKLSTVPTEKTETHEVYVSVHHVVALYQGEKSTTVLVSTGLVYEVNERASDIIAQAKTVGTLLVIGGR